MAKKDKSRQKKFDTRIDFTPMVDMNMLLITFFMLCTTMLKSQTIDLVLPTKDKVEQEEETKIKESDAITFILDGTVDKEGQKASNGKLYYYTGQGTEEGAQLVDITFGNGKDQIRGLLQERNKELLKEVNKLKERWKKGEIADSTYNNEVKKAQAKQAADINAHRPIVIIKPTANACYADVVRMLDEMQISKVSTFMIQNLNKTDSTLYEQKVGHALGAQ
ncbi:MAG: biopolymer transporter ExbD [Muribaculaceae bacterium]|nr:biopolymer transporter ExbD [Muribaculaceae bacterium]